MRTTIAIEDALEKELKPLIRKGRQKEKLLLEKAYSRASKEEPILKDFESIETEEWPEW